MNFFQELFVFSKNQKKGALVLIGIILLVHFFQKTYFSPSPSPSQNFHIPQLNPTPSQSALQVGINTADTATFKQLPGIGSVLSKRIVTFRQIKNGFSTVNELKNVYGLSTDTYRKILPYLYLDSFPPTARLYTSTFRPSFPRKSYPPNLKSIDINSATAEDWKKLPGIGEVLSQRIVKYRKAKGLFLRLSDVQKVYGLPDSTFQLLAPYLFVADSLKNSPNVSHGPEQIAQAKEKNATSLKKLKSFSLAAPININTADTSLWKKLPGIGSVLAKRIIAYKKIIGFYSEVAYLAKVYGLSEEQLAGLAPHLSVGDLSTYEKLDLNMLPEWKIKKYPFWEEAELNAFLLWKKKIRRVDSWQEIDTSGTISPEILKQLQIYFHL